MSRPKLSPLASLLPAKGAAQRPEPLPDVGEQASIHESEQDRGREMMSASGSEQRPSEQTSKMASIGAGEQSSMQERQRPISEASPPVSEQESDHESARESMLDSKQESMATRLDASKIAREQAQTNASTKASEQVDSDDSNEYKNGPRSAVSFRMTERLQDRLREYAHQARRKKQDILDQAVHELLKREGF